MASANIEEVAALKVLFNKQFDSEECNEYIINMTKILPISKVKESVPRKTCGVCKEYL